MKHRTVYIFANGYLDEGFLSGVRKTDTVIGVDRAAFWLIEHGVRPDAAVGDFDSVTATELTDIRQKSHKMLHYPAEKDETDLDLAIGYAVQRKTSHIIVYGGTGSRLDHQIAAVALLERYADTGAEILLRDAHNEARLVTNAATIPNDPVYTYVSVLPVSRTATVSLSGVRYPVSRRRIRRGSTLGISNEIIGKSAKITTHRGKALVIRSRD